VDSADFAALLPLLIVGGTAVLVMLAIAIRRNHVLTVALTLIGLASALAALPVAGSAAPRQVTPLLTIDLYALFYSGLLVAASAGVVLLSYGYLERQRVNREECYVLLLIGTFGSMVLVAASHFASLFLGLEILSVSLYGLVAYLRTRRLSLEAGIKYLVLAAASAAFLLFGMALVYADLGTMEFGRIAVLARDAGPGDPLLAVGSVLIIVGIGFKLALVPFHMWTPDVYEGAPAAVTAFVATVSKGGMFGLLLRYFGQSGSHQYGAVFLVFSIVAVASMFVGNLLALLQSNVKRILAYSSIAHLGYLLVAFQALGDLGQAAGTFYLTAYLVTILGAFGVVTVLSGGDRDADSLEDYRGLFWRRPVVAGVFTAMLFSLAGIPLTAGFLGKFYVVAAGAAASAWWLVFSLVVTSTIGLFYYLRIIVAIYTSDSTGPRSLVSATVPWSGAAVLAALTLLLFWFGVYPGPLVRLIHSAVASVP
jgi:NADH-quinone oxidoreductase subunit N